jgi:hypothetical protein
VASISFHLNSEDAEVLRELSTTHGAKSALIKYAVMNCVSGGQLDTVGVVTGQPAGPFNEKFNVIGGTWSERAQAEAERIGVRRAQLIRYAVHQFLTTPEGSV